jgi:GDP/UDP-N,N'-diacetylbacillosamine 2-epimerase (hydrolysing)
MRSALLRAAVDVDLSVVVTGIHLSDAFGHTVDEIRSSGLRVSGELPVDVTTRTPQSMAVAIGECLIGVSGLLSRERPDMLLLLGDRGEMLAGAIAALHLGIACVHIHGGERSGTVDEPLRHAITKLATYHFVATDGSRERLVRMGEAADRIMVTGAPGLDGLSHEAAMAPLDWREQLGLSAGPFVVALFHPVVQQAGDAVVQTRALVDALNAAGLPVLWLEPNADAGSRDILRALDEGFLPPGSRRLRHLPRPLFCAALRECEALVGNSSAGIIEAASFGTPVVNIGDRQRLRERNANVTDVVANRDAIGLVLRTVLTHGRWPCENVYGDGRAGERIAQLLRTLPFGPAVIEKVNAY